MSPAARRALAGLAPWLLGALGLWMAFHPALASGFGSVQVRTGDPRLVNYLFEHTYRWVGGDPLHAAFWSPPVFHPIEGVGAYTDTVVGTAPLYWAARWLGASPGVAFQLWMMLALSLAFVVGFVFLRRSLGVGPWPAAVGAFLIGFGSSRLVQFSSPQLFAFAPGLLALHASCQALLACDGEVDSRRVRRWIFVFTGALALQAWSAFYPAYFIVLILGAALVATLCVAEGRRRLGLLASRHSKTLAIAALLFATAIAPLALAYGSVEGSQRRAASAVERNLPGWKSWLSPGTSHRLYGPLARSEFFDVRDRGQHATQHSNGVGFLTMGLALAGLVVSRRRTSVRVTVVATGLVLLLCTKLPGDASLWMLARDALPGAAAIRYVARIGIFLAIPVAIGLSFLLERLASGRWAWAAVALAIACVVEQTHQLVAVDDGAYREAVARIAGEVGPDCQAFFVSAYVESDGSETVVSRPHAVGIVAMFAATERGLPSVNGRLGRLPRDYELEAFHVVVGRADPRPARAVAAWSRAHGLDPESVCVVKLPADAIPGIRTGPFEPGERPRRARQR
jgi:hypothetical protein